MIGVFDSGVGGLSVLNEIRKLLPRADLTYVADRARAPYGSKPLEEVSSMSFDVADWLIDRGATCLVVACNTASAAALEALRDRHPALPIVGMEPAVKPASTISRSGRVAVYATTATFQGKLFASLVDRFGSDVDVIARACPQWVAMVEAGMIDGPEVEARVEAELVPALEAGVDVIVLGCTHFSFLKPTIERITHIDVVDPAPAVANQVMRVAPHQVAGAALVLAASGDLVEFASLAGSLAGITAEVITFAP